MIRALRAAAGTYRQMCLVAARHGTTAELSLATWEALQEAGIRLAPRLFRSWTDSVPGHLDHTPDEWPPKAWEGQKLPHLHTDVVISVAANNFAPLVVELHDLAKRVADRPRLPFAHLSDARADAAVTRDKIEAWFIRFDRKVQRYAKRSQAKAKTPLAKRRSITVVFQGESGRWEAVVDGERKRLDTPNDEQEAIFDLLKEQLREGKKTLTYRDLYDAFPDRGFHFKPELEDFSRKERKKVVSNLTTIKERFNRFLKNQLGAPGLGRFEGECCEILIGVKFYNQRTETDTRSYRKKR